MIIQSDPNSTEIIHDYVVPTDIKTWHTPKSNKYIIGTFPALKIDIELYKGVKNYLMQFKSELEPKPKKHSGEWNGRKQGSYKWFETQDSISYHSIFSRNKIIYIHTAVDHEFYFDNENRYINNSCYMISTDSHYLFFFLNSKLFKWYKNIKFVAYGDATEAGRAKLDYNKMITVPIKIITNQSKDYFKEMYKKIKINQLANTDTSILELNVSSYLYKLYNLSFSEVTQIDQDFALSEAEYNAIVI